MTCRGSTGLERRKRERAGEQGRKAEEGRPCSLLSSLVDLQLVTAPTQASQWAL